MLDTGKSYQWQERAELKDITEDLIIAAEEQVLSTRAAEAEVYYSRQNPRGRLRREASETVQYMVAAGRNSIH